MEGRDALINLPVFLSTRHRLRQQFPALASIEDHHLLMLLFYATMDRTQIDAYDVHDDLERGNKRLESLATYPATEKKASPAAAAHDDEEEEGEGGPKTKKPRASSWESNCVDGVAGSNVSRGAVRGMHIGRQAGREDVSREMDITFSSIITHPVYVVY